MHSFSLTALAALFFGVAVSAAPSYSPAPLLKFPISDVMANDDGDVLANFLITLNCMQNVIGNVVGESDLKPLFDEYRLKTDFVVQNYLIQCLDNDEDRAPLCMVSALKEIEYYYDEFIANVSETSEEIAAKILRDLNGKCTEPQDFNVRFVNTNKPSLRNRLQCEVNAIGESSMKNGMTNEWKKYEQKFKLHLDAWKQCDALEDKMKNLFCSTKEAIFTFAVSNKYLKAIVKHPNFIQFSLDYVDILNKKCKA